MPTDPAAPGNLSPDLANLLASNGVDVSALLGGTAQATQPKTLAEALLGSAMDVSGRYGQTGRDFTAALPGWAQNIPATVASDSDFDPYFGIVSQQGDERVYMGGQQQSRSEVVQKGNKFSTEFGAPDPATSVVTSTGASDKTLTSVQAMNLPYTWDREEVADAMQRLKGAGMNVSTFDDLVQAWGGLVNRAAMTYAMSEGERKVTPWDVLDMYKDEQVAAGTWKDPNRAETRVSRNVTEISEGEAWSAIQSNLSQMLGRDPSDQETRDFTYRMGRLAASNPSVSKTVTQYKNGEAVSSATHTDPGFTAQDVAHEAYDQAQDDPDYAEYRASSYLFNSLMSALGPIGG